MTLNDRIDELMPKLNCRYVMNAYGNIDKLVNEIRYETKRTIVSDKSQQLDAEHLREFTNKISKIHKELNKKIDFMEIKKQFDKHEFIDDDVYAKITQNVVDYMTCINVIQHCVNQLNLFAITMTLIENGNKNDEGTFNYLITKAVKDAII